MTTEEHLDRLTGIVESLAASVVHHDDPIADLIKVAEKHRAEMAEYDQRHREEMAELRRSIAETLKRLPPQ
jgi:hypothetical protein